MKKRVLVVVLACICLFTMAACSQGTPAAAEPSQEAELAQEEATVAAEPETPAEEAAAGSEETAAQDSYDIVMVNTALGIEFCNLEGEGGQQAADELGNVNLTYTAPQDPTDLTVQPDMLRNALSQGVDAILIATIDYAAVEEVLTEAMNEGIPIVTFDIRLPDAPDGMVSTNVCTDNEAAAGLAAEKMMEDADFKAAIENATPESPAVVVCSVNDVNSSTMILRSQGFIDAMKSYAEEYHPGAVEVTGSTVFAEESAEPAAVEIYVSVPATGTDADALTAAQGYITMDGLIGVFCNNEVMVNGLLSATNDGSDLDRESGKYGHFLAAGFDAGTILKNAVRNQWFYGAVSQDPVKMGYDAVMAAYNLLQGEPVNDIDPGSIWYNSENMDEPDIAILLYD